MLKAVPYFHLCLLCVSLSLDSAESGVVFVYSAFLVVRVVRPILCRSFQNYVRTTVCYRLWAQQCLAMYERLKLLVCIHRTMSYLPDVSGGFVGSIPDIPILLDVILLLLDLHAACLLQVLYAPRELCLYTIPHKPV